VLIIVAIVLLFLLPDPWNVIVAAVVAVLWLGELYLWNRTVRKRQKVVGTQALIGQKGEVREPCRPLGQVFVAGELWRARCDEGADVGETVTVVAVNGLVLEVKAER
jgi:membrane-bound serine protease (ClpP class)